MYPSQKHETVDEQTFLQKKHYLPAPFLSSIFSKYQATVSTVYDQNGRQRLNITHMVDQK